MYPGPVPHAGAVGIDVQAEKSGEEEESAYGAGGPGGVPPGKGLRTAGPYDTMQSLLPDRKKSRDAKRLGLACRISPQDAGTVQSHPGCWSI